MNPIVWVVTSPDEGNAINGVAATEDAAKELAQTDMGPRVQLTWTRSRQGRIGWRGVGRGEDGEKYAYRIAGWEVLDG